MGNAPKLRFEGFDGEWEKHTLLSQVQTVDTGKSKFIPKKTGKYEILGSTSVIGYDDNYDYEGDFLLTARVGANAGDLYRFSGKVKISDNTVFIQGSQLDFIFYSLIHCNIKRLSFGTGQPLVKASELKTIEFFSTHTDEKEKIGGFLVQLDNLLTTQRRKYDALLKAKQFYLQNLFPKKGEKVPAIRFAGFKGEWERCELKEIANKRTEKNAHLQYTETFTNSAEYGVISQRDYFDHDISNRESINGYYIVRNDDFVYNPRISNAAPFGPINRNKLGKNGIMSPLYTIFEINKNNLGYIEWYFKSSSWHPFMYMNGDSGARSDRYAIKDSVLFEMPITLPCLKEQEAIASFLNRLDSLLTLQSRKLETLKKMKQFMLQNLFV